MNKKDEYLAEIIESSLKHHLVNNQDVAANKGKLKGHLSLENFHGFCRTVKKILKG